MKKLMIILTAALSLLGAVLRVSADPRYALVIGNGDYTHVTPLRNPTNDATDMAAALRHDGFSVTLLTNATRVQMDQGVVKLDNELSQSKDAVGLFYYAGHGVQMNGTNYLIPVNADIPAAGYLSERAEALQSILNVLGSAGNRLNIFVLDACRDNPFSWSRGLTRGLTVVGKQPAGSIIAYSAGAGQVAEDGTGRNGLYTAELLKYLRTPGTDISDIFRKTGGAVSAITGGTQTPATYNQYYGTFYLSGASKSVAAAVVQPVSQPASQPQTAPAGMVLVQGGTFLMGGTYGGGQSNEYPTHKVTLSSFYMAKTEVTQAEFRSLMGFNPSHFSGDDLPVDSVTWYDAVAWCNAKSRQKGLQPVYSITDIQKNNSGNIISANVTADWNANGYRLPTEAEWEYAAKGADKSQGYEYAGNNNLASVAWYGGNSGQETHPVAQKQPNEIGLYDMSGNVWEWCWDWYANYTAESQTNPHGPPTGQFRVFRGGSWITNSVHNCSSSYRNWINPDSGNILVDNGFRPVRSVQ